MLSHFHLIPERHGQTDRRTDRFAISISRVSMLTRDKKSVKYVSLFICFALLIFTVNANNHIYQSGLFEITIDNRTYNSEITTKQNGLSLGHPKNVSVQGRF